MGSWDTSCGISKIEIADGQDCVLAVLYKDFEGRLYSYSIVMPVIYGKYDDYGRIKVDESDVRNKPAIFIANKVLNSNLQEFADRVCNYYTHCFIDRKVWDTLSKTERTDENLLSDAKFHFFYNASFRENDDNYPWGIEAYLKSSLKEIKKYFTENEDGLTFFEQKPAYVAHIVRNYAHKSVQLSSKLEQLMKETCRNFEFCKDEILKIYNVKCKLHQSCFDIDDKLPANSPQFAEYDGYQKLIEQFAEINKQYLNERNARNAGN